MLFCRIAQTASSVHPSTNNRCSPSPSKTVWCSFPHLQYRFVMTSNQKKAGPSSRSVCLLAPVGQPSLNGFPQWQLAQRPTNSDDRLSLTLSTRLRPVVCWIFGEGSNIDGRVLCSKSYWEIHADAMAQIGRCWRASIRQAPLVEM